MKKRIQSLLLVIVMVMTMLPIQVWAEDGPSYTMRVTANETTLQQSTEDQKVIFTVTLEGAENHKVYGIQMKYVPSEGLILSETKVKEQDGEGYWYNNKLSYHEDFSPDGIYTNLEYVPSTKTFACFGATDERALNNADQILMTIECTIPANTSGEFTLGLLDSTNGSQGEARVTSEGSKSNVATVIPATVMVENPATSVTLDAESTTLSIGASATLNATVGTTYDPGPSTDKVVWKSSDDAVATVDENGKVTAVGKGTASITATANGFKDSCEITVNALEQATLTITSADTVDYDDTLTLTTSGGSGDGDVTYEVTDGTGTATITGDTLTATQAGTVSVVATKAAAGEYGQVKSETQTITINKIDYTGTKEATFEVNNNGSVEYTFTLPELPEGARYPGYSEPTFPGNHLMNSISGNELYMKVTTNSADLTVGDIHSTTLAVTGATNYIDYDVDVNFKIVEQPTQTIAFDASTPPPVTYGDPNFTRAVNGAQTAVTYASNNTAAATVDEETGEVTIVGAGDVTITATAESGTHAEATASYSFTVDPKSMADDMIQSISAVEFTGSAIEPTLTVEDGETLVLGTDYTVEYTGNTNAGTATATITGIGNYADTASAEFTIDKAAAPTAGSTSTTVRYNDTATQTVAITGIPSNAGTTTITANSDDSIIDSSSVDGTNVKFALASGLTFDSQTASITATVESQNYEDYTFVVTVSLSDKDPQDISYATTTVEKTFGDSAFTNALTETTVDGAISYASSNTDVATVSATGEVTITGGGTATITATAATTDSYAEATASYTLNVDKAEQSALALTTTSATFGTDLTLVVSGGTTSGTVSYEVTAGTGSATISGATLTPTGAGDVSVKATMAGNDDYNAVSVTDTVTIAKGSYTDGTATSEVKYDVNTAQTVDISNSIPSDAGDITAITVVETTDTNNIISAVSGDKDAKTVSYTPTGIASYVAHTATLTATIESENYNDFNVVITVKLIDKLAQTIEFATTGTIDKIYSDVDFANLATVTTGDGDVSYTSGTPSVADVNATTGEVTIKDVGSAVITATAAETDDYAKATTSYTVKVAEGTITITAEDKSAYSGATEPSYTYTVTGLRAGETLATEPTAITAVDLDMATVGTYVLKVSEDAVAPLGENYNAIVYVDGELTVRKKSSGGGIITTTYYDIEIDVKGEGIVDPNGGSDDIERVEKNEDQVFTFTADKGYEISDVLVNGKSVGAVESYKFEKVTKGQTLEVVFEKIDETDISGWENPFIDVKAGDWFYNGVAYTHMNGLMSGTSTTTFSPLESTTRSMVWTVLARMANADLEGGELWYSKAQEWAMSEGVSDGTYPDNLITREQFVTMLWRNEGNPKAEGILNFTDSDSVSDYAYDAIIWAVENQIVQGRTDNTVDPKGAMTRAEMAVTLQRYLTAN